MKMLFTLLMLSSSIAFAKPNSFSTVYAQTIPLRATPALSEYSRSTAYTPSEFAPASELQMSSSTFDILAKSLVGTVDQNADILVLVDNQQEAQKITSQFRSLGGNVARLKPLITSYDSIWYQDYGPIYSVDTNGQLLINDFQYSRFGRVNDDRIPQKVAALEHTNIQQVTMDYEGGNFIADGKGSCFASSRMYDQNPRLTHAQVDALMKANLGCNKMVVLKPLVDDDTFHIDLFAKMVDDHTFFVGDFPDNSEDRKIMDENARILQGMGYTVYRVPVRTPSPGDHRTHINTFLINGFAIMPTYGGPEDDSSAGLYEKLGYKVLRIPSESFEGSGGAMHCILRSKPKI